MAARLQRALPADDRLARFGVDEFVAVLDDVARLEDVTEVGRKLLRALKRPFMLADEWVTVTASIGGVLGSRGSTSASEMLRDADAAMYAAKARGPGEVEVFDEVASSRSLDRLGIRSATAGTGATRDGCGLPTDRSTRLEPAGGIRGAAALDPPGARTDPARHVHPPC